jgi:hypothetical protein
MKKKLEVNKLQMQKNQLLTARINFKILKN